MENIEYWKEKIGRKITSFASNYQFEIFDTIKEWTKHIKLENKPIEDQIEKIKKETEKLAKLVADAKVKEEE